MNLLEGLGHRILSNVENIHKNNTEWIINMYLEDNERARKYISEKVKEFTKVNNTDIKLGDLKYLCRALKSSEKYPNYVDDYSKFIPNNGSMNRWNPPNRIFLYLSTSLDDDIQENNSTWTNLELTAINEVRAKPDSGIKISICRFNINSEYKYGKILNLLVEDNYSDKAFDRGWEEFEKELLKHTKDLKTDLAGITSRLLSEFNDQVINSIKRAGNINFIDNIFSPLDENDEVQVEYRLFHMLAEEVEKEGYIGILYPSTRMKLIGKKGVNLVLFDKEKYCNPNENIGIKYGEY